MQDRGQSESSYSFDLEMMEICLELAHKAALQGEIPVGALVVFAGKILAQGHNLCEVSHDPTAHAERLVLAEAGRARLSWRLNDCTIYSTLEPCPMCAGAIVLSRIDRLVYGAADPKAGACQSLYRLTSDPRWNHQVQVTSGLMSEGCSEVLANFFRQRRSISL